MTTQPTKHRPLLRRIGIAVVYAAAFIGLPLGVGIGTIWYKSRSIIQEAPVFAEVPPPVAPIERGRRTAVIVAGHAGTESTDLLAPYEVLMASGAFEVHVVARERRPVALFPGTLDLLPHYSYDEYERLVGGAPDLLVIPFIIPDEVEDPSLWQWIREHAGDDTTILTICGGSMVLAETGLLEGRRATSHQNVLRVVRRSHPEVQWVSGERWVEDGNVISSAGITAGIDATLFAVAQLVGRETAEGIARDLGYPHLRYLDDPTFTAPRGSGIATYLNAAYRWGRTDIGLPLADGVGEIELASIIDTYPRSFSAQVHTLAPARRVIHSRQGLPLIPRTAVAEAPPLDRILVPSTIAASEVHRLEEWAVDQGIQVERAQHAGFAYDRALRDMMGRESLAVVASAADALEYPMPDLSRAVGVPLGLLLRPAGLGLLGVFTVFGIGRAGRRR